MVKNTGGWGVGRLACHWYKKLGWGEKYNMDFVAANDLMDYLSRKIKIKKNIDFFQ